MDFFGDGAADNDNLNEWEGTMLSLKMWFKHIQYSVGTKKNTAYLIGFIVIIIRVVSIKLKLHKYYTRSAFTFFLFHYLLFNIWLLYYHYSLLHPISAKLFNNKAFFHRFFLHSWLTTQKESNNLVSARTTILTVYESTNETKPMYQTITCGCSKSVE